MHATPWAMGGGGGCDGGRVKERDLLPSDAGLPSHPAALRPCSARRRIATSEGLRWPAGRRLEPASGCGRHSPPGNRSLRLCCRYLLCPRCTELFGCQMCSLTEKGRGHGQGRRPRSDQSRSSPALLTLGKLVSARETAHKRTQHRRS